ncbi:c-type cytochrome biogenesis protein CcmI [Endozoicomonas sp. OPT23]|uniref:c-type cytochrome biogenesis protein CcmI n=1 Tax=Endozoicomonas sp. OPT23 TaxID=2072845 RepID=UPI00129B2829|nr:c-type cytochrome biogenesis protein CcmI [Endozoicomonas sp. OPT23]MRI32427.1 c-type cytochrome biogenesis protein CcmI [Endozoicomonas sp. OPT23]
MTQFWIIALVLVLVCAALIVFPFVGRSRQAEEAEANSVSDHESNVAYFREQEAEIRHQQEQGLITKDDADLICAELEKKLLNDVADREKSAALNTKGSPMLGWAMALIVPVLAVPVYMHLGSQTEMDVSKLVMDPNATHFQMIRSLEEWTEKKPDNAQAWFMLGSRYMAVRQHANAVDAFSNLYNLEKGSPQAAAELAQAEFLAAGNNVTKRVRNLYEESLSKDEDNATALGLKGIDAFGQADYQEAVSAWTQAMAMENDPSTRQSLAAGISRAKSFLGEAVAEIRVQVELAPELKDLPGNTRVMVFARQPGVRAPVAAIPLRVADLPREVVLDDSSAMIMGGTLSGIESLDVIARITLTGDATSADYEAEVKDVKVTGAGPIQLKIAPAS